MSEPKFDPDVWHVITDGSPLAKSASIVRGNPWTDTFEVVTPEYVIKLESTVGDLKEALAVAVEGLREIDALDPKTDILADAWLITEGILSDPRIQRVLGQKGGG